MRAVTFQGIEQVGCVEVADPEILEGRDAIVRVRHTAVCGSDLHVFHGREQGLDLGTVMGHEFTGEVVALGDDVDGVSVGELVVSPFTTSCGSCFYCRAGLTCRCEQGALFGWVEGPHGLHGAQAEYVRVPLADSSLVAIPDAVPSDLALLTGDILATGTFCAEQGEVGPGAVVAVVGCGPVGLCAIHAALRMGASEVFALDLVDERLAVAAAFGATPVPVSASRGAAVPAALLDATDGRGVDVVLEVVGSQAAIRLAADIVRPGGTISSVGVHTEPTIAFSPVEAYDKNLTFRSGRCPARRFIEPLLDRLASDRGELDRLFSHRMGLDEAAHAYEIFSRRLDGCTKVLFEL